ELGEEVGALREQVQGARIDELPRGRELAAAADAIEERHAELLLELLHRLADGRLAREGGLRCPRETALAHDFGKEAQPAQVEVHAHLESIICNEFILIMSASLARCRHDYL